MSQFQPPDALPPQAGEALPDLSWTEWLDGWEEDDLERSQPPGTQAGSSEGKPGPQSIFSKRSGIQDPLIRPDNRAEARNENDASAEAWAKEGAASRESSLSMPSGPPVASASELADQLTERTPHPGKGGARAVKPKRHLERARRRQKNYLEERRDKKRQRVLFQRVRVILKLCLAVALCFVLWQVVRSPLWLLDQPRFTLSDAHLIQPQQIAPWVQRQVDRPIYVIDTGKMAHKIEKNFDIVNRVVVRRQLFPSRLSITVQEMQPWAEIYAVDPSPRKAVRENEPTDATHMAPVRPQPKPYALLVPDAIISLRPYHYQPEIYARHPLEKIILQPRTVFSKAYLTQLQSLVWQARHIEGLHLQSVDVRHPKRVIFNFEELPVMLGQLNGSAEERLARLVHLIPKIQEFREDMESVDLQWEEQVTFHQKPYAKLDLPKPEQTQG